MQWAERKKIHKAILLSLAIISITVVFVINDTSYPQITSSIKTKITHVKSNIMSDCKDAVMIDTNQQCVSFGNDNCTIWQSLSEGLVVEIQLPGFWASINQFPTTTPGGSFKMHPSSSITRGTCCTISGATPRTSTVSHLTRAAHPSPAPHRAAN